MSRMIKLTKGFSALIDDGDFEIVSKFNWFYDNGYAVRKTPRVNGKQSRQYMHRLIAGDPEGSQVDHVNGDSLDNRRENLRSCNQTQNMCNRKKTIKNTSGHKGVYLHKQTQKWQASIGFEGRLRYLGLFMTKEDAAKAYKKAALELHGDFANVT